MPGYAGHVPGLKYECGKSYTNATKEALTHFTDRQTKKE